MLDKHVFKSPIGWIEITAKENFITKISILILKNGGPQKTPACPILKSAEKELNEYFSGKRKKFSFRIKLMGTEFQHLVWKALKKIPYGKTLSYQDVARKIGRPRAARAVGGACNKNPIGIAIPCHRVIGKNGRFLGYAGGLAKKAWLLKHEFKKSLFTGPGSPRDKG